MVSRAISWISKKQLVLSLSTIKAEYIATALCACHCVWLRRILEQLGVAERGSTKIHCDNNSTIQLSKKFCFPWTMQAFWSKISFLRVNDGTVKLRFCSSEEQIVDIMLKSLKLEQFMKFCRMLGVINTIEV